MKFNKVEDELKIRTSDGKTGCIAVGYNISAEIEESDMELGLCIVDKNPSYKAHEMDYLNAFPPYGPGMGGYGLTYYVTSRDLEEISNQRILHIEVSGLKDNKRTSRTILQFDIETLLTKEKPVCGVTAEISLFSEKPPLILLRTHYRADDADHTRMIVVYSNRPDAEELKNNNPFSDTEFIMLAEPQVTIDKADNTRIYTYSPVVKLHAQTLEDIVIPETRGTQR